MARYVALKLNICLPVAGLGNLVSGLHPKKGIHLRAESLLDPQRHDRRERGAAVEKGRKAGPGHEKCEPVSIDPVRKPPPFMTGIIIIESHQLLIKGRVKALSLLTGFTSQKLIEPYPFYFFHWLNMSNNDFRKQGARKGIADFTYKK